MAKWVVLSVALLIPGLGFGVVEPDPDSFGLYFDENADVYFVDGVGPNEQVNLYLILTNPSQSTICGFEVGMDMVGNAMVLSTVSLDPNWGMSDYSNWIQGFSQPQPTASATILLQHNVLYMAVDLAPVEFYLHGSNPSSIDPGYPTILWEDGVLQMAYISAPYGPEAQINGVCSVVGTESRTFGSMKSLFR